MQKLHETTGYFSGDKNLKIFYRNLSAEKEKARLVIAHGLGEHSGRYNRVINRLVPGGYPFGHLIFVAMVEVEAREVT